MALIYWIATFLIALVDPSLGVAIAEFLNSVFETNIDGFVYWIIGLLLAYFLD